MDSTHLEEVLRRAEQALDAADAAILRRLFESYCYVTDLVEDKNTTIRRLRQLFFGARTEKTAAVVGSHVPEAVAPPPSEAAATGAAGGTGTATRAVGPEAAAAEDASARQGHGRNGAEAYRAAARVSVPHPTLRGGDPCPACGQGTVYDKAPGVVVRITGQPPLAARVYELQKLRCHLCGAVFTAPAPAEAGERKYAATAGSMIALLKYGSGLPFNRLEGLQGNLETPLPASTQWDIVAAVAQQIAPAFEELIRQAAQGEVLHNDDTTIKILSLMGERGGAEGRAAAEDDGGDERRGLFTSGVVALRAGHRVALFFSGRRHAGENLAEVLQRRAAELPPPIQMCDALSRNLPGELQTILANCRAHARRQFVDVYDRFPEPCRYLLEALAVVYRNDAVARARHLSPEARLQWHQQESGPTLQHLHAWLTRQLEEKQVEPNSALGGAIRYMLRHWEPLTLFLRQAGAPLDNNVCERALKKAILHRKNALFYKTPNGARVGDLFMSLIYTCQLNAANPFDYLTQLQRHAEVLVACPERWMPWNYRAALTDAPGARPNGNASGAEAMSRRQPKRAAPANQRPESMAPLRRALSRRRKAELVDTLLELAQADRGVLRQLSARFDVAAAPGELVAATHQAIADATAFDERDINRNFAYDDAAYGEVRRNLGRLIDAGQLPRALRLAQELMKHGSYQVEMSDEGLMTQDIEDCLDVVLKALEQSDLPAAEVVAWCTAMLETDRVGFIAREPLRSLRGRAQAAAGR